MNGVPENSRNGTALVMAQAPRSAAAEAYRTLSTNIQFSSLDRDIRTLLVTSVGPEEGKSIVLANLAINLALVRVMGFRGLALGTALAAMFNAIALLWLLERRLGGLEGRRIATSLIKIVVASLVMGLAAWSTSAWLTEAVPGDALLWKVLTP